MHFARVLGEAIARQNAGTPLADAIDAFEQALLRDALLYTAPPVPMWARILQVADGCSEAELRRAYRRRAFVTHPDRDGGSVTAFLETQRALQEGLVAIRKKRP